MFRKLNVCSRLFSISNLEACMKGLKRSSRMIGDTRCLIMTLNYEEGG